MTNEAANTNGEHKEEIKPEKIVPIEISGIKVAFDILDTTQHSAQSCSFFISGAEENPTRYSTSMDNFRELVAAAGSPLIGFKGLFAGLDSEEKIIAIGVLDKKTKGKYVWKEVSSFNTGIDKPSDRIAATQREPNTTDTIRLIT